MQSNIRHLSSVDRYRALSAPKVNRIRVYTEVSHAALEAARDRHGADPLPPDETGPRYKIPVRAHFRTPRGLGEARVAASRVPAVPPGRQFS